MNEDDTLVYRSLMNCQCTGNTKKQIKLELRKQSTTAIYICNPCSLKTKSRVKHLYVYPENGVEDYDIFLHVHSKMLQKHFKPHITI